jgi:hypothetical protein
LLQSSTSPVVFWPFITSYIRRENKPGTGRTYRPTGRRSVKCPDIFEEAAIMGEPKPKPKPKPPPPPPPDPPSGAKPIEGVGTAVAAMVIVVLAIVLWRRLAARAPSRVRLG